MGNFFANIFAALFPWTVPADEAMKIQYFSDDQCTVVNEDFDEVLELEEGCVCEEEEENHDEHHHDCCQRTVYENG